MNAPNIDFNFSPDVIAAVQNRRKKEAIKNKLQAASNNLTDEAFNKAYKGVKANSLADYVKDNSFFSGVASANYKLGAGVSRLFGYEDTANEWQQRGRELDAHHELNRGDSGLSNFLYGLGELVDPTLAIGGPALKGIQAGAKVSKALAKNAAKIGAYGAATNAAITALDQDKSKTQVVESAALGGVLGGALGIGAPLVVNKFKTGSFLPKAQATHTTPQSDIHTSSTSTQGMQPNTPQTDIQPSLAPQASHITQDDDAIALNIIKEKFPDSYNSLQSKASASDSLAFSMKPPQIRGDNFITQLGTPHITDYTRNFNIQDYIKNTANINPNSPILGDLEYLSNKHPEMFKKPSDVFKLIQKVLDHPTYFYPNNNPNIALMGKVLDNGKLGKLGIEKDHPSGVNEIRHLTQIDNAVKQNEKLLSRGEKHPLVESAPPSTQLVLPIKNAEPRPGANAHSKDIKGDDTISTLNNPLNSIDKPSNKQSLALEYIKKHYPALITKTDVASGALGGSANVVLGDENDSIAERFAKGFALGLAGSKGIKSTPALYHFAKNSLNHFETLAKENPQLFTRILHKQALKQDYAHFVGTKALDIKPSNLITAKALKEKGISDDIIFENTGWFEGKDGKWRFELSLNDSHVYKLKGDFTLNQILKSDALFKAYPHLKELKLSIKPMEDSINGMFDAKNNLIHINHNLSKQDFTKALIHEVQHAIQKYEGHALGSKPKSNTFKDYEAYKNTLGEKEADYTYKPNRGHNMLQDFKNASVGGESDISLQALKTYSTLVKYGVKDLHKASQKEYEGFVQAMIGNDIEAKKKAPNILHIEDLNPQIAQALGIKDARTYFTKAAMSHVRPSRKNTYNQALRVDELLEVPQVIKNTKEAYIDVDKGNFILTFPDKNDTNKLNYIHLNKDELGNYMVTMKKADAHFIKGYQKVSAEGLAPTIPQGVKNSQVPSTTLTASTDNLSKNNAQSPLNKPLDNIASNIIHQIKSSQDETQKIMKRKDLEKHLNIQPISHFGKNYAEYYHDGKGAITKLLQEKQGQVSAAFYKEGLGDIDLVWGAVTDPKLHKGYGIAHILDKHPDFDVNKIQEIIQKGIFSQKLGGQSGFNIEYDGFKIGINQGYNKEGNNRWIVTAFNNGETVKTARTNDSTKGVDSLPSNSVSNNAQSPLNKPLDDDAIMYSKNFADFDPETRTSIVSRTLESIKVIKSQPMKESLKQFSSWIKNNDAINTLFGTRIYTDNFKEYRNLRSTLEQALSESNAKAIDLHNSLSELGEDTRVQMYRYMVGDIDGGSLSKHVKALADAYMKTLDDLSELLVKEGLLSAKTKEKWGGVYLMREYSPKLMDKLTHFMDTHTDPSALGIGKRHLRGKQIRVNDKELASMQKQGKIGNVREGKWEILQSDKDGNHLLRRDFTKLERERLKEQTDIAYALPKTLQKIEQELKTAGFFKQAAKLSNHVIKKDKNSPYPPQGYKELKGYNFGALKGFYVKKEIADDIENTTLKIFGETNKLKEAWFDLVTYWKKTHTVYNPTSHINNLIGNITMLGIEGDFKAIAYIKDATKVALKVDEYEKLLSKQKIGTLKEMDKLRLKALDTEDMRLYKNLKDKGVFGGNKLNGVLNEFLLSKNNIHKSDSKLGNMLRKVDEKMSNAYGLEDTLPRFALIKSLMQRGHELDRAISIASSTLPDYSKPMPKWMHASSRYGVMPFIQFSYHSIPIMIRQLTSLKNHAGENVALKKLGVLAGVLGGYNALSLAITGELPLSEKHSPKGFGMKELPFMRIGDNVHTLRTASMIPHASLAELLPFTGKGFLPETLRQQALGGVPQNIAGILMNKDWNYDRPITNKDGVLGAYHISKNAVQSFSPDGIDKVYNLIESILMNEEKRKRNKVINERNVIQNAINFIGLNVKSYNQAALKREIEQKKRLHK